MIQKDCIIEGRDDSEVGHYRRGDDVEIRIL